MHLQAFDPVRAGLCATVLLREESMRFSPHRVSGFGAAALVALALAGCKEHPQMNPGMPQVSVITVQPTPASIVYDLQERGAAVRDAQIRAHDTGIVKQTDFEMGGEKKNGETTA